MPSVRNLRKRPEYLCRPSQIGRRLLVWARAPTGQTRTRLAWGDPMIVDADQMIGHAILRLGVFDLLVAEALWRLTEPGDVALDVGAHLGLMTSLLARQCGSTGRVHAVEPQPATCGLLRQNVTLWSHNAEIHVHEVAASDRGGEATFYLPGNAERNDSLATLSRKPGYRPISVELASLDDLLLDESPTIAKLDVEGAELPALQGAKRILGTVRDLVFEHADYPTRVTTELENAGFTVMRLEQRSVLRPALADPRSARRGRQEGANMLATRQPERVVERFRGWGWRCLRS